MSNLEFERERPAAPRIVVVGLASCFGCQLQITNAEPYLLDVLGQIDLRYWQLASSDPMPEEFDVAVIEGAATTAEAIETLKAVRKKASAVIAVGACATTAGIPGMAAGNVEAGAAAVYGEAGAPVACGELVDPAEMAALAAKQGYCAKGRGSYLSIVNGIARTYGLASEAIGALTVDAVYDALLTGDLLVALVGPGHFTSGGHFIVLRGVTLTGKLLVADPVSDERSLMEWDPQLILDELSASRNNGAPLWVISPPTER